MSGKGSVMRKVRREKSEDAAETICRGAWEVKGESRRRYRKEGKEKVSRKRGSGITKGQEAGECKRAGEMFDVAEEE